ncbi:MAG: NAD(P)-binding domain-containing protein, partial [Myxococcales bacterium]|nr:NAD(P)-binding domain-containing protein [Myxococcales bacterium]
RYLEDYAASFNPPLRAATAVTALRAARATAAAAPTTHAGGFELATTEGDWSVGQVVVATGGYHEARVPRMAERLPPGIRQLHSSEYRRPEDLPEGEVLVVGTGQSGCQIAEDLHIAGRRVHLSVGSAPRTARRYRGKDVVDWLDAMGYYSMPVHEHPLKDRVRAKANHYVTGRDGGRDIDLRQRALEGMALYGRLRELDRGVIRFADDLAQNLDQADAVSESIKDTIDQFIRSKGIDAPPEARYRAPWRPPSAADGGGARDIDLARTPLGSVVWSTGFRSNYTWIELPVFDGKGYPSHQHGVTSMPGLYFLGLPWLHTWGSGRFSGVGADATYLADRIHARIAESRPRATASLNELALGS